MKLSKWAKLQGISYITAWRWHKAGKLPVPSIQAPSGTILIQEEQLKFNTSGPETNVIYCRVSTHDKKQDLERQGQRCAEFCAAKGWIVHKIYSEIASGMNDNRPKLKSVLASRPTRIIIEHKDRLTRFGFGYFEQLLPMIGTELVVINRDVAPDRDLCADLIAIITSFCCRLYGLRSGRNKANKIKQEIECKELVN